MPFMARKRKQVQTHPRAAWVGAEVEAGVVESEHALERMLDLTGRAAGSMACEHNPQPRKLSQEVVRFTGQLCLCDVIYTPADEVETSRFLQWYHPVHFRQAREGCDERAQAAL